MLHFKVNQVKRLKNIYFITNFVKYWRTDLKSFNLKLLVICVFQCLNNLSKPLCLKGILICSYIHPNYDISLYDCFIRKTINLNESIFVQDLNDARFIHFSVQITISEKLYKNSNSI